MESQDCIVEPFRPELGGVWDRFVSSGSRNGGIFHEQRFLGYHAPGRFLDRSLLFFNKEKECVAVLPAASLPVSPENVISHPGSTVGGIVYRNRAGMHEVLVLLEKAIHYYSDLGMDSLEFRLAEAIFSWPSHGELPYLLWHRGFTMLPREASQCVSLAEDDNWLVMGRKKNPTDIRAALRKGLQIVEHETADTIYGLLAENLKTRYGKLPTHSLQELNLLKSLYPDRIHFWSAMLNEKVLGVTVIFEVTPRVVYTFYITQDYSEAKLHPMPTLFYHLFDHYRIRGFSWFHFGISSRRQDIKWGILESKEFWGGRSTFKENWRLNSLQDYKPYVFTSLHA